jgi:hypothetical protein
MKSGVSNYMQVIPVNFSSEAMLGNCKMLLEKDGGCIAVNPRFDKLITSLRTADSFIVKHHIYKQEGGK